MSFTPFLLNRLIETIINGPTWLALLDERGEEIVNVDYARIFIDVPTGADPKWSEALTGESGSRAENTTPISFVLPTVNWGRVQSGALYDADPGGNRLTLVELSNPRDVFIGDPFIVPARALKVTIG